MSPQCSVILPAYNEGKGLVPVVDEIVEALGGAEYSFEVIIVDDGSKDDTWQVIQQCCELYHQVKGLRFARNFGHQLAVHAGIKASSGKMVAIMDADGQDPPELLRKMFALLEEGYDVVNCVRQKRKEPAAIRTGYYLFYRVYSFLTPFEIPLDSGDFSAMNRKTADVIAHINQHTPFLRGIRSWAGGAQINLPYERRARQSGTTKYSLGKLFLLAASGLTSFSKTPLRISTIVGAVISTLSLVYAILVVLLKLFLGYPAGSGGWTSLAVLVSLLSGVQLMVLGILGEYLGHIFDAVRGIPPFHLAERSGFDAKITEAKEEFVIHG